MPDNRPEKLHEAAATGTLTAVMEEARDTDRGALIRALRRERGRTQKALAHEVGVSERAVQLWEHGGEIAWPNVVQLARVLGTPPETLLPDGADAPATPGDALGQRVARLETSLAAAPAAIRGELAAHDQAAQAAFEQVSRQNAELRGAVQRLADQVEQVVLAIRELRQDTATRQPRAADERPRAAKPSSRNP